MIDLTHHRRKVDRLLVQRKVAVETVKRESVLLFEAVEKVLAVEEAQSIAQQIAQTLQQQVHQKISRIVTQSLQAVFDDPYEFKIIFDRKRGKTEARMVFVRDGVELDDPMNEVGGGVIDVASLALRLASVLLSRPPHRRLIILDEPFKNVRGKEFRKRVRGMMLALCESMGFQFVLNVDHHAFPEFTLGKIVELS